MIDSATQLAFEKYGFSKIKDKAHAVEFQRDDLIVYYVPLPYLNVVVHPSTDMTIFGGKTFNEHNNSNMTKFPKHMKTGKNPIPYGYMFKCENIEDVERILAVL